MSRVSSGLGWVRVLASGQFPVAEMPMLSGFMTLPQLAFPQPQSECPDVMWLLELCVHSDTERGLILALRKNPDDTATRAAYGDWLEEQGRMESAKNVMKGWTPFAGPTSILGRDWAVFGGTR